MTKYRTDEAGTPNPLKVLAHPLRMRAFNVIRQYGPLTVKAIAGHLSPAPKPSTLSVALGILRDAKLVTARRLRRDVWYAVDPAGLAGVLGVFKELSHREV